MTYLPSFVVEEREVVGSGTKRASWNDAESLVACFGTPLQLRVVQLGRKLGEAFVYAGEV